MRRTFEIAVTMVLLGSCTALNSGPPTGQGGGLPAGTGASTGVGAGGHGGSLGQGGGSGLAGAPGGGGLGPAPGSGGTVGAAGAPGSGGTVASGGAAGGHPGSGGAVAAGGRPGSGGNPGSGGVTGSGGYSGAGTAIIPDATGHVVGTTNAFGITGDWYSYTDGAGATGTTATGDCEVAQHSASQCSTVSPTVGTAFANTGGKMCTSGTAARILDIVGMTGMPDYRNIYGSAIALDFNYTGTKGTFSATANASGKTVTGLSFDISFTTAPTGEGLRVEFPTPPTDGSVDGAAYWGADQFFSSSPITASGTYKVYFADVRGPRGVPFDQTKIESIAFHVPSNTTSATSFNFCVSNLTVLTDNGGGCPPPLAGGSCNIPACGCPTGEVCYPYATTMNLACFTSNNLAEGADCRNATCPSGLGCFGGVCRKYCHSDVDCPTVNGARACAQTTWSTTMAPVAGVDVCQRICDPVSPQSPHTPLLSCPSGFACIAGTTSPGLTFCTPRTGIGAAGTTCATDDDCAPGNFCADNGTLCWHFCYSNADCVSPSTCAAFASTPNYAGTTELGYCTQ